MKQLQVFFTIAALAALLLCLTGCKVKERVVTVRVPEVHDVHHWHTDSTSRSDSTFHEKKTIVMQADSAMMARFGIQLKENERAWLIRTKELEQQIRKMERMIAERDTVHDSIPYPVPVPEYIPAELTWWQQTRLHLANIVLYALAIFVAVWAVRLWMRR